MKKANMIALIAMFLTASVTFATANFQAFHDDPPVLDCWKFEEDVNDDNNPAPDMSIERDCPEGTVICCYTHGGGIALFNP